MSKPVTKYFGNLSLDGIKKAVTEIPGKRDEYNGEQRLKISAAAWDDGGISIDIYNSETKETIKLGNLRISQFSDEAPAKAVEQAPTEDLPF